MSKSKDGSSKKRKAVDSADTPVVTQDSVPSTSDSAPKKSKKSSKKATEEAEAPVMESMEVDTAENKVEGEAEAKEENAEEPDQPDVPALSHKAQRLAKRRRLAGLDPVEPPSSAPTTTSASVPEGPAPIAIGNTPAKSAHGIWVGNLSFKTTGKVLLDWFEERGLKEVTRLNLPNGKRDHEANRGFAYIDFPSATDVEIAVGLSEQHLDGRKLLIKSSTDYTGRPAPSLPSTSTLDPSALSTTAPGTLNKTARKILDKQKNPAGPTLFMGNLGFETTVEDIKGMFDAHQVAAGTWERKEKKDKKKAKAAKEEEGEEEGSDSESEKEESESDQSDEEEDNDDDEDEDDKPKKKVKGQKGPLDLSKAKDAGIRKVRLGTFEDTGKCKGWAFVDFHLPEQCTRALLNIHNHNLNGRNVVLEYASADAVRRGNLGTRAARGGAAGGGRGGRGAAARERGHTGESKRGNDWDDGDMLQSARAAVDSNEDGGEEQPRDRGQFAGRGRGGNAGRGGRGAGSVGQQSQGRAKPGAALATAQRASEAIVESRGKKITFD